MDSRKARGSLQFIIDNQKTVTTAKLYEHVDILFKHINMLERDNKKLRRRIKRQKGTLNRINQKLGRDNHAGEEGVH